jgi:DNA-binding response OmpR family regulator
MKVIIIEDDADVVEVVAMCFELRWPDATVLSSGEGSKGMNLAREESPDIVILDLGLPDMDGFEVLRQIRSFSDVPLIVLSVRDQKIDIAKALELGADDYITKPFDHIELLARVKAVLRRAGVLEFKEGAKSFQSSNLQINFDDREVLVNGKPVKLTPIEYNLLCHLARNANHIVTHQSLLEKAWGKEYMDASDYLKVYIQRLRAKLGDNPRAPGLILTERGVGYKLVRSS